MALGAVLKIVFPRTQSNGIAFNILSTEPLSILENANHFLPKSLTNSVIAFFATVASIKSSQLCYYVLIR